MSGRVEDTGPGVSSETADGRGERLIFHHLVRADDALTAFYRERAYFTVCGQVLRPAELPSSLCQCNDRDGDGCREVVVHCPACLREAASVNAEYGVPGE